MVAPRIIFQLQKEYNISCCKHQIWLLIDRIEMLTISEYFKIILFIEDFIFLSLILHYNALSIIHVLAGFWLEKNSQLKLSFTLPVLKKCCFFTYIFDMTFYIHFVNTTPCLKRYFHLYSFFFNSISNALSLV